MSNPLNHTMDWLSLMSWGLLRQVFGPTKKNNHSFYLWYVLISVVCLWRSPVSCVTFWGCRPSYQLVRQTFRATLIDGFEDCVCLFTGRQLIHIKVVPIVSKFHPLGFYQNDITVLISLQNGKLSIGRSPVTGKVWKYCKSAYTAG